MKFLKRLFLPLLLIPFLISPLLAEVVRPVVRNVVSPVVFDVTSFGGGASYTWTFAPKSTSDLSEIASLTSTRNSTWMVPDYLGVYNEIPIDVTPFKGARWTGTVFESTEADGTTPIDPDTICIPFYTPFINVIGSAQFNDFTHADWNFVNGSITAGNVVLIDGTTVADKNTLTASAANATMILDPYVSASGVHSGSFFIKRKTGTDIVELTMDGGTTWVDITSEIETADWKMPQTTLPTVTDPEIGIRLVGSGDAVYICYSQMGDGIKYCPPNPVKGGESLAAQIMRVIDADIINGKEGSIYAEVQLQPEDVTATSAAQIVSGYNVTYLLYATNSNNIRSYDGTGVSTLTNALNGKSKIVNYWWDSSKRLSSNGASSIVGVYAGTWKITSTGMYIGSYRGTSQYFNGDLYKIIITHDAKDQAYWETETTP